MGKLRKIGRQLKKGIKKLFKSPLGGILGSMAINFMFPGIGNFFKGAFKGAKSALGFGDAAAQAGLEGAKLTAEVGAEAGKVAAGAADKLAQSTLSEGTKNITASTFNSAIESGVTPIDKAINVNNVLAEGVSSGTIKPTVNNSITQTLSETANIVEKGVPDSLFEKDLFADAGSNLVAEQGATFAQAASDPTKFARLQEGATFGEKIGRFASDPIGMTAKGAKNLASSAVEGVTSGEFVGDVATGVTSSLIMQEVMGEPEQPFVSRGVQPSSPMEMAQGSYIQDIAPSYAAATNTTRVPSFQEISQQTLYGTGTPQYMSQFYQPLASPTVTG